MNSNSKILTKKAFSAVVFGLCLAGASACSPEAGETPKPGRATKTAAATNTTATGTLETSAGAYNFTPDICIIHIEDGAYDIEIGGMGQAPDGEKIYVELSSTGNHVVVTLGADNRYSSTGRKIQGGRGLSKEFALEISGQEITANNLALIDNQGQPVDGNARLRINCGK